MTHLMPEQRPDKSGKIVTRHVRSIPKRREGSGQMPAPRVDAPEVSPHKAAADTAWAELEAAGMRFSSGTKVNLEYLATHDRTLLAQVVERCTSDASDSEKAMWQGMITFSGVCPALSIDGTENDTPEKYLSLYRDGLEFYPFIARLIPIVEVKTLDHYRNAKSYIAIASEKVPEGLVRDDPNAIKAVLLAMRVEELKDTVKWYMYPNPENIPLRHDDIIYLADNMESVDSVVEDLLALRATDSQAVDSLSSTGAALRDGVL